MSMRLKDVLVEITEINAERFGSDDVYSDEDAVLRLITLEEGGYFLAKDGDEIVGYLLYKMHGDHISCERRAVTKSAKRKGFGVKLTKMAIKKAKEMGVDFKTYCSVNNMASLNSNIKCGCKVTHVGTEWVYLKYVVNK